MVRAPALLALSLLSACVARPSSSPYAVQPESARDSIKAQSLTQRAAPLIDADPARAERLLREALAADLYHGPAHNNLGVLYLQQSKLYEAAGEFEWAKRLMPGHPDPRVNLALTLERAGRAADALASYHAALDAAPDSLPALMGLTRLELRRGTPSDGTRARLQTIALQVDDPAWRDWAQRQLALCGK